MQPVSVMDRDPSLIPVFDRGPVEPGDDDSAVSPQAEVEEGPPEGHDPAAPWGFNPTTGKPYTKSPEERAAWGERMRVAREAAKTAGRSGRGAPPKTRRSAGGKGTGGRPSAARPAPAPAPEVTYAQTAAALLSIPAMAAAVAGRLLNSPALMLDSMAISLHIPPIAEAAGQVALENGWLSTALESAAKVSPWGQLAMALMPLGAQIATNHRFLPPNDSMGTLSPEDLVQAVSNTDQSDD